MPIVDNVLELIGKTPLVRLRNLPGPHAAEVVVKLEAFNPAGSTKDRAALSMIEAAEADGTLKPGATIIEPTSGNTGIGLAMVAAVKGYKLVITMPDDASSVRRSLLRRYGARVILTPAGELMKGAIERAKALAADDTDAVMLQQFDNDANPDAHRRGTALEILEATDRKIDGFVAGIGTGGTFTGVGQVLKEALPDVYLAAVEPRRSPALSGGDVRRHSIEGIGAGFVPNNVDRRLLDEVFQCDDKVAADMSTKLASREGVSAGPSGGAAVWGAIELARRLGKGKRVVTIVPDAWDRYATDEMVHPARIGL